MNYYEVLELDKTANFEDIKKSYRKLAMKYHPDRTNGNKQAEEKFKKINEAYITLSDPDKKNQYDYSLNTSNRNRNSNADFDPRMNEFFKDSFEDIFRNFGFQGNFRNQHIQTLSVTLEFWEAALGCKKNYEFNVNTSQGKKKAKVEVIYEPATNPGDIVEVNIENHVIHLQVNVLDNLSFERDNLDIYSMLEVPLTTGILGGTVVFPHWTKDVEISIPAGVDNGTKIRLANMGVKKNIYVGDLYLVVKLITPKKLNKKQKELMEEFNQLESKKDNKFNESLKKMWATVFNK